MNANAAPIAAPKSRRKMIATEVHSGSGLASAACLPKEDSCSTGVGSPGPGLIDEDSRATPRRRSRRSRRLCAAGGRAASRKPRQAQLCARGANPDTALGTSCLAAPRPPAATHPRRGARRAADGPLPAEVQAELDVQRHRGGLQVAAAHRGGAASCGAPQRARCQPPCDASRAARRPQARLKHARGAVCGRALRGAGRTKPSAWLLPSQQRAGAGKLQARSRGCRARLLASLCT